METRPSYHNAEWVDTWREAARQMAAAMELAAQQIAALADLIDLAKMPDALPPDPQDIPPARFGVPVQITPTPNKCVLVIRSRGPPVAWL